MKGQYTTIVQNILNYLRVATALIILFIAYSIYTDIQEQKMFNRMMVCDGYAYDQEKAPNFCK